MAGEEAFKVEGTLIEALQNGTYRVALANGHEVIAFAAGRAKQRFVAPAPGGKVKLQMSPYDLSEGRIIVEPKAI